MKRLFWILILIYPCVSYAQLPSVTYRWQWNAGAQWGQSSNWEPQTGTVPGIGFPSKVIIEAQHPTLNERIELYNTIFLSDFTLKNNGLQLHENTIYVTQFFELENGSFENGAILPVKAQEVLMVDTRQMQTANYVLRSAGSKISPDIFAQSGQPTSFYTVLVEPEVPTTSLQLNVLANDTLGVDRLTLAMSVNAVSGILADSTIAVYQDGVFVGELQKKYYKLVRDAHLGVFVQFYDHQPKDEPLPFAANLTNGIYLKDPSYFEITGLADLQARLDIVDAQNSPVLSNHVKAQLADDVIKWNHQGIQQGVYHFTLTVAGQVYKGTFVKKN
ncbi:MAG: hypothetical protein ACPGJS_05870 [Flammeovirgaceae bacterium]